MARIKQETKSLDPNQLFLNISNFKLVVSDIDYTLVNFEPANKAGIKKLKEFFGDKMGESIDRIFQIVLEGNRKMKDESWNKREEYNSIMKRIRALQVKSDYEPKVWSREAYIIIAAEDSNIEINKKKVEEARDVYWKAILENYSLFADAEKFMAFLKINNIPLILMTGSDAVLRVNEELSLNYDPDFSREYKLRKLSKSFPGLPIIIGDPIDKPDTRYFDVVSREIEKLGNFSYDEILFVGDSEKNDLMVPRGRGYSTLLVRR